MTISDPANLAESPSLKNGTPDSQNWLDVRKNAFAVGDYSATSIVATGFDPEDDEGV